MPKQTITEFLINRGRQDVVFDSIVRHQKKNKLNSFDEARNHLIFSLQNSIPVPTPPTPQEKRKAYEKNKKKTKSKSMQEFIKKNMMKKTKIR